MSSFFTAVYCPQVPIFSLVLTLNRKSSEFQRLYRHTMLDVSIINQCETLLAILNTFPLSNPFTLSRRFT